jgi:hypothetical protein
MVSSEFEPVSTNSGELWKIREVVDESSSVTEIFSVSKQYDYSPHEHEILQHCQGLYTRKVEILTPQQIRTLNGIYLDFF